MLAILARSFVVLSRRGWLGLMCVVLVAWGCAQTAVDAPQPVAAEVEERIDLRQLLESVPRTETEFPSNTRLFAGRYGTGLDRGGIVHLPRHVQTLPEIHERYVTEFTERPGFGMDRYHWQPSQWVELVSEDAPSAPASTTDEVYPAGERPAGAKGERPQFDDHKGMLTRGGKVEEIQERLWVVSQMQLVSLLKEAGPAVYVTDHVDQHAPTAREPGKATAASKESTPRATRALDAFESPALATLRGGKDVVVRTTPDTMRVFGAIRARADCLSCHKGAEGDLLGAFTYTLALKSEATPAESRLADLEGLSADEVRAVGAVEKLGGQVRRDPTQPARPVVAVTLKGKKARDAALKDVRAFAHLRELDVSSTQMTDAGLKDIAQLRGLRKLDLGGLSVTAQGLRDIQGLPHLEELNLWATDFTDAGVQEVAGFRNLRALTLAYNVITDAGLAHLRELKDLRRLDLAGTKVTDDGVRHVNELRQLKELDLTRTGVTDAGVARLRQALPECQVKR